MNIRIANRLLEYRRTSGYSQEELAAKIGVSRQAVSKWERAEASPDTDNLISLAELYGVTIDELINGNGSPAAKGKEEKHTLADKENNIGIIDTEKNDGNFNSRGDTKPEDDKYSDDGVNDSSDDDNDDDNDNDNGGSCGCCGKDKEADKVSIGFDGIHVIDKNGDKVHIKFNGIHIEKNNGDNVYTDPENIQIHNEKGETEIEIGDKKINGVERHHAPHWFNAMLPVLTVIAYLIMGFSIPDNAGWTRGWLVFFLIPVVPSFFAAVRKRKPGHFAYPIFAAGLYLFSGMVYDLWHPEWIIFLTIPIYYIICGAIEHNVKKARELEN